VRKMRGYQKRTAINILVWMLIVIIALAGNSIGCSTSTKSTPAKPTSTSAGSPTAGKASSSPPAIPAFMTKLVRPTGGKVQEFTFALKPPTPAYNGVISLSNGETLDVDWKFVGTGGLGIRFVVSTPEGRELDAKLQPLNVAGHPFYDANLPTPKLEEAVGGHLEINAGQDKYCGEGIYTLIYNVSPGQTGNIYLSYSLITPGK
jgi:hypothetical protein